MAGVIAMAHMPGMVRRMGVGRIRLVLFVRVSLVAGSGRRVMLMLAGRNLS